MQRLIILAALPLCLLALGAQQPPPTPPVLDHTGLMPLRVVDCVDGGKLIVEVGGHNIPVHLLGVKATDPNDRSPSLAQNGASAKTLLTTLSSGEEVYLDPDEARRPGNSGPRWAKMDEKGVVQAHVWRVRDSLLLNAEVLKQGFAFYNSADSPRDEYLLYYSWCQRQANDAHIGLWSSEQLVAAGLPPTGGPSSLGAGDMPQISMPGGTPAGKPALAPTEPDETPRQVSGSVAEAAELPSGLSVGLSSARVTKRGKTGWDYAWKVSLHNENKGRLRINLTVQFLDQDGYVLDETTQNVSLSGHGNREAKGVHKLDLGPAAKVASISILATRAR